MFYTLEVHGCQFIALIYENIALYGLLPCLFENMNTTRK